MRCYSASRYVPLALALLGPVIVNILSFHVFLDSENIAPAIVVTVLWFVVFSQVRSSFAGLFEGEKCQVEVQQPLRSAGCGIVWETVDQLNQVRATDRGTMQMLMAVHMVPLRVWNCSLEQEQLQFQTKGMNRTTRAERA